MGIFLLGIKQLLRDWRGGELGLLASALVLAVASVAGIVLLTDQMQRGLEAQSSRFLAADRQITTARPVPDDWRATADTFDVQWIDTLEFVTMSMANDTFQLASVKAVEDGYPLRGAVKISEQTFGEAVTANAIPSSGHIWAAPRLLGILGIDVGDEISIGMATFIVEKVLVSDPGTGLDMGAAIPRLIMRYDELEQTGVIQPGSRLRYRYLIAGNKDALAEFESIIKPQMNSSQQWVSVRQGPQRIARALKRSERFMTLGGGLVVVLAGIAIAMASRRYAERHLDATAVLKSLGVTRRQVLAMQLGGLLVIGSLASLLGILIGLGIQSAILKLLSGLLPFNDIQITSQPIVMGLLTGYLCILVFAMPPIWQMARVSPVAVLRADQKGSGQLARWFLFGSFLVGSALLGIYSRDWPLTMALMVGLGAVTLIFSGLTWLVLHSLRVGRTYAGSYLRMGLASLRRRGWQSVVQVSVIAQALMLVGVVFVLRSGLIDRWQAQLPENAPNHFAFNIGESETKSFEQTLQTINVTTEALYPMVRGRLTTINDVNVSDIKGKEDVNALRRELNLTWTQHLSSDNRVVEGRWFSEADRGEPLVSVEAELAQRLDLRLGDRLGFQIAERRIEVTIASFRSVEWDSMNPNFFMIFPADLLTDFQPTYLTSFFVPEEQKDSVNTLLREFPTVTVLPVDVFIKQIQTITLQAGRAIEVIWLLVFGAGILVLLGTVQSSLDDRYRESALIRSMGGTRRVILGSLAVEFVSMGILGGMFAAVATEATVFLVEMILFDLRVDEALSQFRLHHRVWIGLPFVGGFVTGLLGFLSCRRVVSTPPMTILREAATN